MDKKLDLDTLDYGELANEAGIQRYSMKRLIQGRDTDLNCVEIRRVSKLFDIREHILAKVQDRERIAGKFLAWAVLLILLAVPVIITNFVNASEYREGTMRTNRNLQQVIVSQEKEIEAIRHEKDYMVGILARRIAELEDKNGK